MWQRSHRSSEERKLELRLGPPSEESLNGSIKKCFTERNESPLTLGYSSTHEISTSDKPGPGGAMLTTAWRSTSYHQHQAKPKAPSFFQLQSRPQNMLMMRKEVPQLCCVENMAFSPSSADAAVSKRYSYLLLLFSFVFKAFKLLLRFVTILDVVENWGQILAVADLF